MIKKLFTFCASGLMLWGLWLAPALAQAYPSQPIRIIVPGAAGSVPDVFVRRLSDHMSRSLGQPVVVDNRPGANGFIGAEAAARAKADGYTLLYGAVNVLSINPALFQKLPYDPVRVSRRSRSLHGDIRSSSSTPGFRSRRWRSSSNTHALVRAK